MFIQMKLGDFEKTSEGGGEAGEESLENMERNENTDYHFEGVLGNFLDSPRVWESIENMENENKNRFDRADSSTSNDTTDDEDESLN
mmetsp:Transcript_17134/g.25360  ORF Transcript_17134/g.25360 Transcript_17134/m.25360 type:complete len:87 (-) Transcript_17134:131-391(-)|eukprot:CAMPEP_0171455086 /NCGR_PEP_ID=MMETSP0945-20130129/2121_1 /TAXON_ID=109269 /ORGANISM="Vaucheria litorea, Strain CCMP2940" /LENGTH=86 /DNA_ID=CAMNT_0011980255 /DNA_START=96 /DNA_END=356 /DNA_ORIENTATION=-